MKKSILQLSTVLLGFVILSSPVIAQPPEITGYVNSEGAILSAEIWSDDFDDKDISDWQLFCVNTSAVDPKQPGNSSADEGVLRNNGTLRAYAGHNSSTAFGTWSFDVDVQMPDGDDEIIIAFMSEEWNYDWPVEGEVGEAYVIVFYLWSSGHQIRLAKTSHENGVQFLDSETNTTYIGWQNVIVTREMSGYFYVYLNRLLILEGRNMQHTTSERFYFISFGGPAIDNVSVSDTIDYDAAPPRWVQNPADQEINVGELFNYDLNATDFSGLDHWWIDDTDNFAIDDNGVITNNTALTAGDYPVHVWVNDTLGFTLDASFTVTVSVVPTPTTPTTPTTSTTPPDDGYSLPLELILAIGGGAVVIIVILVILTKRRS